jgi:hypothetical protein
MPLTDLDAREIAAWRMTLPTGHRFEATQALRQTLTRAVEWGLLDTNPAKTGVDNPQPPRREMRPRLRRPARGARRRARTAGRTHGPVRRRHRPAPRRMDRARAARHRPRQPPRPRPPSLPREPPQDHQDRHAARRAAPALRARRARPAPLATKRDVASLPAPEGGYLDLHNWRPRHWRPAQRAAGITPTRRLYDLRHTFAPVALRAGLGTFELSRYMGTSLINIDRSHGHLARDSHQHAVDLLDDYNSSCRHVDAGGRSVDVDTPLTSLAATVEGGE